MPGSRLSSRITPSLPRHALKAAHFGKFTKVALPGIEEADHQ
jgi:hypothetical protein